MTILTEDHLKIDKNLPLLIRKILGDHRNDFLEQWQEILRGNVSLTTRQATAGVLLLLRRHPRGGQSGPEGDSWVLQLIKRSARTAQGGDISCPGGMLHPTVDWAFGMLFIRSGLLPLPPVRGKSYPAGKTARQNKIMATFFANALRESWEELRLNPLHVSLLGILPIYSLHLFRRAIFPLVAVADPDWLPAPNSEVEKLIEIPLGTFFRTDSYGRYLIHASDRMPTPEQGPWEFPCLLHIDDSGEEILWGATFYIIMNFLRIVFAYHLPDLDGTRIRHKILNNDYLTGNRNG